MEHNIPTSSKGMYNITLQSPCVTISIPLSFWWCIIRIVADYTHVKNLSHHTSFCDVPLVLAQPAGPWSAVSMCRYSTKSQIPPCWICSARTEAFAWHLNDPFHNCQADVIRTGQNHVYEACHIIVYIPLVDTPVDHYNTLVRSSFPAEYMWCSYMH